MTTKYLAVGELEVPGGGDSYQTITSSDGLTWAQGVKINNGYIVWGICRLHSGRLLAALETDSPGDMIFYSDNDGATWTPATTGPDAAVTTLVWSVKEVGTTGLIALAGCSPVGAVGPAIYRTTDGGVHWARVPVASIVDADAASSHYDTTDILDLGGGVVIITYGGKTGVGDVQWRMSTDSGVTFSVKGTLADANPGDVPVQPWQLARTDDGHVVSNGAPEAGGNNVIWRATIGTGSMTWHRISLGVLGGKSYSGVVNCGDGSLLASFEPDLGDGVGYRSIDNGATWTLRATIPSVRAVGPVSKLVSSAPGVVFIGLFGNDTALAQIGRSADAGATWSGKYPATGNNKVTNFLVYTPAPPSVLARVGSGPGDCGPGLFPVPCPDPDL